MTTVAALFVAKGGFYYRQPRVVESSHAIQRSRSGQEVLREIPGGSSGAGARNLTALAIGTPRRERQEGQGMARGEPGASRREQSKVESTEPGASQGDAAGLEGKDRLLRESEKTVPESQGLASNARTYNGAVRSDACRSIGRLCHLRCDNSANAERTLALRGSRPYDRPSARAALFQVQFNAGGCR